MSKRAMVVSAEQRLPGLAGRINEAHRLCEQAFREGLQHAITAGELLIEAKALCQYGEWLDWLRDNCDVSERTAQAYMRVARNREALEAKAQHVAGLAFCDAVALLAEPKSKDVAEVAFAETRGVLDDLRAIVDDPGATLADLQSVARLAGWVQNEWAEIMLRSSRVVGLMLSRSGDDPLSDSERAELARLESKIESALVGIPQELRSRYLELALSAAELSQTPAH